MRATVSSGLETVALSKGLKAELEGAEIKMSFFLELSRMDRSSSRDITTDNICWRFWT